jgi:hypothetical protein
MKTINYKVDDVLSPQQVLGRQHDQELERIKILKNIGKRASLNQEKKKYVHKQVINNEEEFIRKLDIANTRLKRSKARMQIIHHKKYVKKWRNPSIARLSRARDFFTHG